MYKKRLLCGIIIFTFTMWVFWESYLSEIQNSLMEYKGWISQNYLIFIIPCSATTDPVSQYTELTRFAGNLTKNCSDLIRQTGELLRAENLSYICSALEEKNCDLTYQRMYARSSPENVFSRSRRCELDWPEYGEISSEGGRSRLGSHWSRAPEFWNIFMDLKSYYRRP